MSKEREGTHLLAVGNVELEQLVRRLLKVERRHDGEVDGPAQVDDVGARLVVHVDRAVGLDAVVDVALVVLGVARALLRVALGPGARAVLVVRAEDLVLDLGVGRLIGLVLGVDLEDVCARGASPSQRHARGEETSRRERERETH